MASRTFSMTNIVLTTTLTGEIVKALKHLRNVKGDKFATAREFDMLVTDPLAVIDGFPEITRAVVSTLLATDCSDYAGCIDFQVWDGSRGRSEVIAYFRRDDSLVGDDCWDCDNYSVNNIYSNRGE